MKIGVAQTLSLPRTDGSKLKLISLGRGRVFLFRNNDILEFNSRFIFNLNTLSLSLGENLPSRPLSQTDPTEVPRNMFEYEYPRPAVSVDIIVSRIIDGEEHVLLIQRKDDPFQGSWALPGGFLDVDETLEQAAARELKEETCLDALSVSQIGTFSAVDRDPRFRVITTVFEVATDPTQTPVAADDAADWQWKKIDSEIELAFDHAKILKLWKKKRPLQA